jgi:hypothetical protein
MASTVDAKLLRATKFPPEFNQKVDMQKVNLEVMKKFVLTTHPVAAETDLICVGGSLERYLSCLVVMMMW